MPETAESRFCPSDPISTFPARAKLSTYHHRVPLAFCKTMHNCHRFDLLITSIPVKQVHGKCRALAMPMAMASVELAA